MSQSASTIKAGAVGASVKLGVLQEEEEASGPPSAASHGHQDTEPAHRPHAAPRQLSVPKPHLQPVQLQLSLPQLRPDLWPDLRPDLRPEPERKLQPEPDLQTQPHWSQPQPTSEAPETQPALPPLSPAAHHSFLQLPQEQKESGKEGEQEEGGQEEPAGA